MIKEKSQLFCQHSAILWLSYQVACRQAINRKNAFTLSKPTTQRFFSFCVTQDKKIALLHDNKHTFWLTDIEWASIHYERNIIILTSTALQIGNITMSPVIVRFICRSRVVNLLKKQPKIYIGAMLRGGKNISIQQEIYQ